MSKPSDWYQLNNPELIDSPALIIYKSRVEANITTLINMIDDVSRLRPHVKTHKAKEAAQLCLEAGITKFKCATIPEAEILAMVGAPDVLLAYQPTLPKLERLLQLINEYPQTIFSCVIDNLMTAKLISEKVGEANIILPVFIDLNVGMNRTGIKPGAEAIELYKSCKSLPGLQLMGLHAYDGHIHATDMLVRTQQCEEAFAPVEKMKQELTTAGFEVPVIVAGGSPSFPFFAKRGGVECSPGTFIYWDKGYSDTLPEQNFLPAALVLTRVISLPSPTTICIDLGHKSIAAEKDLQHRVFFINAPDLVFIGQSEEHLVADAGISHSWKIGDVLYGMPLHVCPTCALYNTAQIIESGASTGSWQIIARDRKITI